MIRYAVAAVAALVSVAAPAAAADFTGPRVAGHIGFADDDFLGTESFTYGANVGYDYETGGAVLGVTAEWQDSEDSGRDLSAVIRAGGKASDSVLVYALAGYTNLGVGSGTGVHLDGVRVGGGVEVALGRNAFVNVEQRYSNYELGVDGFQTVAGIGFRF